MKDYKINGSIAKDVDPIPPPPPPRPKGLVIEDIDKENMLVKILIWIIRKLMY